MISERVGEMCNITNTYIVFIDKKIFMRFNPSEQMEQDISWISTEMIYKYIFYPDAFIVHV